MIDFTLLICVYAKENPIYLTQCLDSIAKQTVMPSEIVIVKDGPLPNLLEQAISEHELIKSYTRRNYIKTVALSKNMTLGPARARGVVAAKYEWIALMDTDDTCKSDRFEKQLSMIANNPALDLIGGQIAEFTDNDAINDTVNTVSKRTVPLTHDEILSYAKKRNPFNHMTVMFKREAALSAGNYRLFPWLEDYDLWARMIRNGAICANHSEILVDARINKKTFSRRRGTVYAKSEWMMQRQLKSLGFINTVEFILNIIIRIPVRLLPGRVLTVLYQKFLR